MTKNKKNKIYSAIVRVIFMMIGAALAAIALEVFLLPNSLTDGGITGVAVLISHITKLPLGLFILILNLPFQIIGYKQIGKTFCISSLFSIACLSIGVSFLHPIPSITHDILLAAVFGGIIMGAGVGLIIRNNGSVDGVEVISILLDRKSSFSVGEIIMFFNLFILGASGFVFGWDKAMYSLIAYFVAFKTIDITVEGLDESKAVIIVSEKNKDICEAITGRLGRSATLLDGKGSFAGKNLEIIYVVVSRLEIAKLKGIVNEIDENALITVSSVEATGKSHGKKAIH